uniref:Uncharacterized protein isoform X2 n=1 Tax=Pogona vitticeps TaxID=103695 RepID=A0ABM5FVU4_9SAUR
MDDEEGYMTLSPRMPNETSSQESLSKRRRGNSKRVTQYKLSVGILGALCTILGLAAVVLLTFGPHQLYLPVSSPSFTAPCTVCLPFSQRLGFFLLSTMPCLHKFCRVASVHVKPSMQLKTTREGWKTDPVSLSRLPFTSVSHLQFPTQVGHWMLVTILILLAQNCSYPAVRRIGVDDELPVEVWSTQDRIVDERLLQPLERLLTVAGPRDAVISLLPRQIGQRSRNLAKPRDELSVVAHQPKK